MVRALIGVCLVVALTACGGDGEGGDDALPAEPSATSPTVTPPATPPPASPPVTPRPRSKKKVTGDICDKVKGAIEEARQGGSLEARSAVAFTMLELQSARPDLDPGLVKILDTHQNQPAKALKLIAEWCDKNGY